MSALAALFSRRSRPAAPAPASSGWATSDCRSPSSSPRPDSTRPASTSTRARSRRSTTAVPTSPTWRPPTSRRCATAASSTRRPTSRSSRSSTPSTSACRRRCARRRTPTCPTSSRRWKRSPKHLHPGLLVCPRVDDLSGHDRGSRAADARGDGPQGGRRLLPRVLARARRPGQPDVPDPQRAEGRRRPARRRASELASALYGTAIETIVPVSSTRVAEMVKLLENTFRAVNIGLVNELALMCDRMNIDVWEVVDAAKTKPFGFMAFYPGPGLGGHCIPIDPFYLSWKAKQSGFDPRFIELAGHINGGMPHYVVDKVAEALNTKRKAVNGSKVLIAGVAYKRDIDDMRESPALDVMGLLHARGAQGLLRRPVRAGGPRPRVVGAIRHQGGRRRPRIVRPVRLHRDRHRPQVVRLRRDGRRGGSDRRHAQRDQEAGPECLQARRAAPRGRDRRLGVRP